MYEPERRHALMTALRSLGRLVICATLYKTASENAIPSRIFRLTATTNRCSLCTIVVGLTFGHIAAN